MKAANIQRMFKLRTCLEYKESNKKANPFYNTNCIIKNRLERVIIIEEPGSLDELGVA